MVITTIRILAAIALALLIASTGVARAQTNLLVSRRRRDINMDLARANLIRDLKDKMGVNDEGLGVILHLVDQMHTLRRALAATLESARERRSSGAFRSRIPVAWRRPSHRRRVARTG